MPRTARSSKHNRPLVGLATAGGSLIAMTGLVLRRKASSDR
jgi:hypothetical protein